MAVTIKLKKKYLVHKSSGGGHKSTGATGNKKVKATQGNGVRRKTYGPF